MSGNRQPAPTANQFLNGTNYNQILTFLRGRYAKQLGTQAIPERLEKRLQDTVKHFMTEVNRIQGTKAPVKSLNQEVLKETTASVDTWLERQKAPAPNVVSVGTLPRGNDNDFNKLFEDPSTRYEKLMAERAPPPALVPAVPDFRAQADMLESNEDPVLLMQRMKQQREDQARGMGLAGVPPRLEIREEPPSAMQPIPPQAEPAPPLLAPRPQDYIIPQEDIVKYRETEHNIFLTSSDRDWLRNNTENRYNFSVNFNTGSKKQGFNFNPALQERFRNIQRIEFVKAILPIESLTPLVRVAASSPSVAYDVTRVVNVFSLPFAGIRIAELNNNGFSTNPYEDNTFAIVQYDTTWSSDLLAQNTAGVAATPVLAKTGYTGLIPKFLKTQKVYTPTPLATLQRLSIRMERHSGELLSADSDVQSVQRICMSNAFTTIGTNNTLYGVTGPQNAYIFIQTAAYFSYSAVSEGDNIQIQGYAPTTSSEAAREFTAFINNPAGLYVVATGYVDGAGVVQDGRNNAGYCNVIIVRNRFNDPKTGSVIRDDSYFGGSSGAETTFANLLDNVNDEPNQTAAALINLSRQTHLVLRIITRDMDSTSNIRPDNV